MESRAITDINQYLEQIKTGSDVDKKKATEELVNILLSNQEEFAKIEKAGQKAVIRQYLKNDKDLVTTASLPTAIKSAVISGKYSELIKELSLYTKEETVRKYENTLTAKSSASLVQSFGRLVTELNKEIRLLSENSFEHTTVKEIVIELSKIVPEHRKLNGSVLDSLVFDIWVGGAKLTPEQAVEQKLYVDAKDTIIGDNTLQKNIYLKEMKGDEISENDVIFIKSGTSAYFTINKDRTLEKIIEFINANLYLIKSLELKPDYSDVSDLTQNLFVEPLIGFITQFTTNSNTIKESEELKRTIEGTLAQRPQQFSKQNANQNGYVDAVLSITDGRTAPVGINEKNMRIDEQTIITRYFAGERTIYKTSLLTSANSNMPVSAIARTVSVYLDKYGQAFLIIPFKSEAIWAPIGVDFVASTSFDSFWRNSHITEAEVIQANSNVGDMKAVVTTIDGQYNPERIDMDYKGK